MDSHPRERPARDGHALRERKKRETSRRIHDAALDLTLHHGATNVTVRQICETAEVSTRTFFNYFPSKTAAVLGVSGLTIGQSQRERFLSSTGPVLDDVCELMAATIDDSDFSTEDHRRVTRLFQKDPELGYEVFSMMRGYREELRGLVAQRSSPHVAHAAVALAFTALPFCYAKDIQGDRMDAPLIDRLHVALDHLRTLLDR